ncbi:MAG TPA: sialidase family protein, partial [Verrucomicrobiae bacterium]
NIVVCATRCPERLSPGLKQLVGLAVTVFALAGLGQSVDLYVTNVQVNVDALGQNITGDAANEPSLCIDPIHPNRIAIGWRQFDTVTNDFRQAGWAYSTNGGFSWTFPGVLETGIFRSDPVLASDADGVFYYLGVLITPNYHCDMFRSTDGGATWQYAGLAEGGDKEWMAIDTTSGPGRGNIYQAWSPWYNYANDINSIFTRSTDAGTTWTQPTTIPNLPYWGTLAVGPAGEVYMGGWDGVNFWVNRSTNAQSPSVATTFDVVTHVNLGGGLIYGAANLNPVGLLGQPWVAVDHSTGATRGNVYLLCSVSGAVSQTDVMFARSTNSGVTWSSPMRINDDVPNPNAYHWFGALSVAPNGRLDACWNDTRNDPTHIFSELYYAYSQDGGLTWSKNVPLSRPFNHTLGYPVQQKMGDYLGMVSLNAGACIAYAATFNGEEDIWFARVELPVKVKIALSGNTARLAWDTLPDRSYAVQMKGNLEAPWAAMTLDNLAGTGHEATVQDTIVNGTQRFYRVVLQP